ncbi:MAG TPA: BON domain-containing protein [Ktedonobacteraceae bacterium]|nr:BON domain-containing protein [Ktedonobacteraceae bacterium]
MGTNARVSEMLKFHFGNKIFCTDGQDGVLTRVLFDAATRRLTHLAVRQGRFFGKTVYLPFEQVTTATADGIWLNSTLAELAAAPTADPSGAELDPHTVVKNGTGSGSLALVAVQPGSGELAYIVVRNLPAGRSTMLREQYIAKLESGQITITADTALLMSLPPYRSDRVLQQEVEQILFDLGFLHIDLKGMSLRVLDGVLYMDGNISSALRGELAQDQVAGVEGLLEIKNNLIADDTLAAQIALALGQDERTRELPIGVYPQLGVVRLSGSVRNAQQKTAAEEIARKFAGVRGVINDLLIDPSAEMLYVMSAPEGGETRDIAPGKFIRHTK